MPSSCQHGAIVLVPSMECLTEADAAMLELPSKRKCPDFVARSVGLMRLMYLPAQQRYSCECFGPVVEEVKVCFGNGIFFGFCVLTSFRLGNILIF